MDERQRNVLLRAYAYDAGDPHVCCGNCKGVNAVPCEYCGYDLWCPECGVLPPHDCRQVRNDRQGRIHACSICHDNECGASLLDEDVAW